MTEFRVLNKSLPPKARHAAGLICVLAGWIYSYSGGGSPDAFQQIFFLGALSAASLLFGLSATNPLGTAAVLGGMFVMVMTPNPYLGGQIAGAAGLLLAVLACHLGAHLQRKPEGLPWLLFALVAAAFINAIEGLLQWFGLVGELYRWVVEPERRGVAFGVFRQTNLFATFLCVGSICTVWLVHQRRLTESMAWFLLLVSMFAVAASGSRTGLLEVLTLAVLGLLWRKQHAPAVTRLLVGQSVILGIAQLTLSKAANWLEFEFVSGVERAARMGMDARLTIWSNALDLIAEHPWLGWGWRETVYGHYVTLFSHRYKDQMDNVHNLPLQLAVELGLPVTIAFFGVVAWAALFAKPLRVDIVAADKLVQPASDRQFAWAILLLIIGIHSMLEYPLWYAGFLFLTGLAIGYVLPVQNSERVSVTYGAWSKRIAKIVALGLILLALIAWQQYANVLPIYKTPFTRDREARRAAMMAAITNASGSWLFKEQLDFARLDLVEVTPQNAVEVRRLAEKLLHYSAEPRVIQSLLLSLWYLNDGVALQFHAERFCHAFPIAFQRWSQDYANHPMFTAARRLPYGCLPPIPSEQGVLGVRFQLNIRR